MSPRSRYFCAFNHSVMDYTKEEAADAIETARELNVDVEVVYADNDSILQGQQIMEAMDAKHKQPAAGIIVMPVGTNLPHLARAAAKAGIGWAVMHREADYEGIADGSAPVISLSSDNMEAGRIQGRQMAALLPQGGTVLYLEGPAMSVPSRMRRDGMMQTKPENITLRSIHSKWGRQFAQEAIATWMKLSTFRETKFDMVAGVADGITMGARDELLKAPSQAEREHWSNIPYLGCDGCRQTGMVWLSQRQLTATVRIPHLTGLAMRLLQKGLNGERVERRTVLSPESYPDLSTLANKAHSMA